ncbi:putative periplasmic component, TRAP-type C4-dicarboxylate transport system [Aurantimonas manganoxydans SI85-9A1]|uniref:Putative periplasmic component, TRAP-type C4-dicarboxylate transport system n=1 Tax=Aurantimonas manganoxydans (strain ATCC BAA-1229 / DSM 21871 / SI85-9A1) TaxID=287752 RepID=Q1YKY8_AURMS|nr:TRAP transporter substrate-binding protein [Aurantimonas manganoxydans]EAS50385.1 putative periplasmic component, TRAP-type C4-dicarboxylate transport system [Aurantimonas manganoxydans SI85-9A1]
MFKTVLQAAITAAVLVAAPLASAHDLKLADFQPPSHFVVGSVYEPFKTSVETATGGEVTVTFYMGGELGPGPSEQYNRTVEGVTDIAFGLPGYTAANFPKTLLTELPGVIDAATGTDHILANMDMLSNEYRRVALLGLWNNAPNLLLSASKPIGTLEDLQGMKIRVPSRNAGLVVEAWGATPVSMPAPEIYNAMQTGVIDGAMIDATALKAFKLGEVTKFVTQGMKTTISSFFLIMNRDALGELTDEQRQAVTEAGRQAARHGHDAWQSTAETVLADFGSTDGKEVITLPAGEAAKFDAGSAPVVERVISEADGSGIEATAFVEALKSN